MQPPSLTDNSAAGSAPSAPPPGGNAPLPGRLAFRELLHAEKFVYGAELVTTRGIPDPGSP